MIRKALVVGFACWSVVAVAQSSGNGDQAANPKQSQQDAVSGLPSGKRMHKPMSVNTDADANAKTPATTKAGGVSGGKSATDDWSTSSAKSNSGNGQGSTHVATGDVNGDGRADPTATKNSGHATEQNAVASPRDVATGQTSGKRQHDAVVVTKTQDASSPAKTDQR